jgi:hypothetical protein
VASQFMELDWIFLVVLLDGLGEEGKLSVKRSCWTEFGQGVRVYLTQIEYNLT